MATTRRSPEAARAALREVGRLTVLRLVAYYLMVGVLLLYLSALLPQEAIGPTPSQPPPDMQGAIEWFRGQVAVFPRGAPLWTSARAGRPATSARRTSTAITAWTVRRSSISTA